MSSFFGKLFGGKKNAPAAAPAVAASAEPQPLTNREKAEEAARLANAKLNNYKNNPFGAPEGLLAAKKVAANAAAQHSAWNAVMKPRRSRRRHSSRRNRSRRSVN